MKGTLGHGFDMPDPVIRPHNTKEQTPDLVHPHFSNCTVPVVFFLSYMSNAHEIFDKLFVMLWVASRKDAWDPRYTIMLSTLGQGLQQNLQLYSAFHSNQQPVRSDPEGPLWCPPPAPWGRPGS